MPQGEGGGGERGDGFEWETRRFCTCNFVGGGGGESKDFSPLCFGLPKNILREAL